jgi:transcription-repair coupling factor (superfamily II helicase)
VRQLFTTTELKLSAQAMGLLRVDVGPTGGRIEFGAETRVDPVALVRLVQSESNTYRLDGGTRLRVTKALDEPEQRATFVRELLERLAPEPDTTTPAVAVAQANA